MTQQSETATEQDQQQEAVEDQQPTRKQRIIEAAGKEVALDLFLYSCLEQERLVRARGEGYEAIEWPLLTANAEGARPLDQENMPLAALLTRLCVWYRDNFPALATREAIDHTMLSEVVPALVALNQDISLLYKLKVGEDLPEYEKSVGNNRFWDDIQVELQNNFPSHAGLFLRYVHWSHAAEPIDDIIPGEMPPVGRYAPRPLFRNNDRGGPRGPRGGGRGDRGGPGKGNDRGPRGPRGPRGEHGERGGGDRQGHADRGGRGDRGDRGGRGGRQGGPERGPRGGRQGGADRGPRGGGGAPSEETKQLESTAMAEVDAAIKRLQTEQTLDEVILKPTNSFYRRLQHQRIVDAGYHSFSVGEGPDRSVRVARRE